MKRPRSEQRPSFEYRSGCGLSLPMTPSKSALELLVARWFGYEVFGRCNRKRVSCPKRCTKVVRRVLKIVEMREERVEQPELGYEIGVP